MDRIARNIKENRKNLKMTQDELAERLHVTRQTVSNYENGKSNPDIETLQLLADVYNMSLEDLIYGEKKSISKNRNFLNNGILVLLIFCIVLCVLAKDGMITQIDPDSLKIAFKVGVFYLAYPVLFFLAAYYVCDMYCVIGKQQVVISHHKTIRKVALSVFWIYFICMGWYVADIMIIAIKHVTEIPKGIFILDAVIVNHPAISVLIRILFLFLGSVIGILRKNPREKIVYYGSMTIQKVVIIAAIIFAGIILWNLTATTLQNDFFVFY